MRIWIFYARMIKAGIFFVMRNEIDRSENLWKLKNHSDESKNNGKSSRIDRYYFNVHIFYILQ